MRERTLLPPLPVALKASPLHIAALRALVGLLATGLAVSAIRHPAHIRADYVVTVALLAYATFVGAAVLHACSATLNLTTEGFTFYRNFRMRFVPWRVVQSFRDAGGNGIWGIGSTNFVTWMNLPGVINPRSTRIALAGILGFDGFLPARYGIPADELCDLLNRLRDHYGAPTPELWVAMNSE
jgi:hypothetical protein